MLGVSLMRLAHEASLLFAEVGAKLINYSYVSGQEPARQVREKYAEVEFVNAARAIVRDVLLLSSDD